MCFFGGQPKTPDAPPPPPPPAVIPPPPTQSSADPTQISAQTAADRTKRLNQIRFGLSSTVKTGPRGIVGAGSELQPQEQGKKTLG